MCRRELTPEAAMLRLEHYHDCTRWSGNGAAHLANYALHKVGHWAEARFIAACWLVLLPAPMEVYSCSCCLEAAHVLDSCSICNPLVVLGHLKGVR